MWSSGGVANCQGVSNQVTRDSIGIHTCKCTQALKKGRFKLGQNIFEKTLTSRLKRMRESYTIIVTPATKWIYHVIRNKTSIYRRTICISHGQNSRICRNNFSSGITLNRHPWPGCGGYATESFSVKILILYMWNHPHGCHNSFSANKCEDLSAI
jgi:hypothetical protein